jgi:DNA-binding MarR family transcriptional regulator
MEPADVSESTDTQRAARELLHAVMVVMRTLASEMRRSADFPMAPAQFGMLMKIASGPCTVSDVARHQAVSLPTISKSLDVLVRRGWVERRVDHTDRRLMLVGLTPAGRRVMSDVRERAADYIAGKLAMLSPAERANLVSATALLAGVISTPGETAN